MMGFAMVSAEAPVTKTSSSILAFKEDIVSKSVETACINCARCVDVCPSRIIPSRLADLAQRHDEKAFVAMDLNVWNVDHAVMCVRRKDL